MSQAPPPRFDLVVVGAGHAGCEAALAAARLGASCLLITFNLEHLAALSCNPAVGGLAKGHLVKEIDALGGEMALNTDASGIQFRLLNRGKGPAVWSSRAQVDMDLYPRRMLRVCQNQPGLWLLQAEVTGLTCEKGRVTGVKTHQGQRLAASRVILTTGTFLRGVIHVGLRRQPAGRMGDPPAQALSRQLQELGFNLYRLKTGTTPRLDRRSLDLEELERQPGDRDPRLFSFLSRRPRLPQVSCWITHTTEATHRLIRDNLDSSPMYAGVITGVGARYCPSIEDKVVRFADRPSHHVFLEPQGLRSNLVYPNGIPTSLPLSVQEQMVRSLPGCRRAFIVRPGYAIEYDMADPLDLGGDLQSKLVAGLYLAGQINGTSGYEEAAAQGLWAGLNAVLGLRGREPLLPDRSRSYLEVLVDDLVTKGTREPYRMFTSRAEYRLSLREDNADLRLTPLGRELGLVDDQRWALFRVKQEALEQAWRLLQEVRLNPSREINQRLAELGQPPLKLPQSAARLLRRPGLDPPVLARLHPALEPLARLAPAVREQLEIRAHYAGYHQREREQVARFKEKEQVAIPPELEFRDLPGLSREVAEKLERIRPRNLGQASRISGVTPAALAVLSLHLHRLDQQKKGGTRRGP